MTKNAVQAAMEAARQHAAANPNQVATINNQPQHVAVYTPPRQLGLDDIQAESMIVDGYLLLTPDGFKLSTKTPEGVKKESGFVEKIHGIIDTNSIAVFEGLRYGSNPTVYEKTFNMSTSAKGEPWSECVRRAQMVDPKIRTYQGADVPLTLLEDMVDIKGNVVLAAGGTVGQSTPQSGRKNLKDFTDAVTEAGLRGAEVEVIITVERKSKPGVKDWAVTKFELIGEYVQD